MTKKRQAGPSNLLVGECGWPADVGLFMLPVACVGGGGRVMAAGQVSGPLSRDGR